MDFRAFPVSGKGVITINVFEAVKQAVTTREAAEFYGIKVNRGGMAVCPFHDDKNPSMKVDKRFHCFGCGADGDVIYFVSRLFDLDKTKAALKLAVDFGVSYEYNGRKSLSDMPVRSKPSISEELKYRQEEQHTFRVLADYFHLLQDWEIQYAPQSPEDDWHPLFVEAIQRKTHVEYLLDTLIDGSKEDMKGNNGLLKRKYITFGIEAESLRVAKAKLERIELDVLNNFKTLGVKTYPLSGYERLKVLHDVFNMDTSEPFRFSFDMVARTGLSSKDFIAPTSVDLLQRNIQLNHHNHLNQACRQTCSKHQVSE